MTRKRAQEALVDLNATLERQVTERTEQLRKNEEALRQSQKMEAVGQLTGGVAHDFNNLLQIILGNLDTLQRNLPAESGRLLRAARNAMTGAQRAATLTQRLLAFSRRQSLDPKPLDVNALVNGLSDMIHRTLGETIDVETVLGAGVWRVEADPAELEAAVINLAVNARDAMTNGGRLTIETSNAHIDEAYVAAHTEVVPGQYVAIAVTDTGVGMDSKTVAQAFEPFFHDQSCRQGHRTGAQPGVWLRQAVRRSRQDLLGSGTGNNGEAVLAAACDASGGCRALESNPSPEAAQEETVLVLEDDDEVRAYSVETLRELGYRVIEAHDGPSALRLLERQPRVDLLFTDVVLPGGLTGAQVAAQAKTVRPTLKVLFTTGYARNAIVHHGRLDKGVQLLVKPFSFSDLAAKVRDVLDGASD
ncbi:CheY-like chemotaxis protein [Bradyrhizobium sp. GM6.1]